MALLLGLGWVVIPTPPAAHAAPVAFNPFSASGNFTIYGREDVTLENQELEGSVAAGDTLTRVGSGNYAVLHVVAGTGAYTLPTVDGDPTRVLAGTYSSSSGGILYISSAGTSEPSLLGDLKLVERDNPWQYSPRGDWLRLNPNSASPDQEPVIDAVQQDYPADAEPPTGSAGGGSIYTVSTAADAVADYVEANAEATWDEAQQCLADIAEPGSATGNPVTVTVAGGVATLTALAPDRPNIVEYADLAGASRIQFGTGEPRPGALNPLIIRVAAGTTTVSGVSIDPQGAYSPYTMWDLSAVTGEVSIGVPGTRMDGSVYAPNADVTVNASPLDGQIIGNDVTVQGGEVHSFLFSSEVSCLDQFRVHKVLEGIDASDLPDGFTFTLNYTATLPSGEETTGTLELPADGSWVTPEELYPTGTVITFAEIPAASIPGYEWAVPVVSPQRITVGEGDGTIDVTVTNTATQPTGTFTVSKLVSDGDPDVGDPRLSGTVPVDWTATYDGAQIETGTLDVPLDGAVVGPDEQFPAGTEISLEEDLDGIDPPDGYVWSGSEWTPASTITIGEDETTALTLINLVTPDDDERSITILKSTPDDPGAASDAYEYAVGYNLDADNTQRAPQDIFVGEPTQLTDFPDDADTLDLSELLPLLNGEPVNPADWEEPRFVVDGVTYEPGGWGLEGPSSAIPVGEDTDVVVEVINERRFGTFELSKLLEGIDADALPEGTEFTVLWRASLPEGRTRVGVLRLPADGTAVSPVGLGGNPIDFPYGTTIDFTELPRPAVRGILWSTPVFEPQQLVVGAGGEATVSATVTNTASGLEGTFAIAKSFSGIDASQVAGESAEVAYVVVFPDRSLVAGRMDVPFDGTPVSPVTSDGETIEFPIGSQVWLTEAPLPEEDLPDGYAWAIESWDPASSFTISGAGQVVQIGLTNSVEQFAQFSVTKLVDGTGAAEVPPGLEFTVDWWLDGEPQEPLTVTSGETAVSFPVAVNSLVEVAEAEPLPDAGDGTWQEPVWVGPDGPLEPESNGRVVVPMTVGPDETVALQLTNTVDAETTSLVIDKAVAGDVPDGTEFTVEYAVDGGDPETATVTVGDPAVIEDLPVDAEVELREVDLPEAGAGDWADPTWSVDGEALAPDDDGWVTVTADADEVVLDLVNTLTPDTPTESPTESPTQDRPELPGTGTDGVPVLVALAAGLLAVGLTMWARARRARSTR